MTITSEKMGESDEMEGTNKQEQKHEHEQEQEQEQPQRMDGWQTDRSAYSRGWGRMETANSPVRCRLSFDGADVRRNPDPSFFLKEGSFPSPHCREKGIREDEVGSLLGQALPEGCTPSGSACTCPRRRRRWRYRRRQRQQHLGLGA